jgi:hypothetical protein
VKFMKGPRTNAESFLKASARFSEPTKRGCVLGKNCNMLRNFANFWRIVIKQVYPLEVEIQFI